MTPEVRAELDQLVSRYALLVDRRDLDGAAGLFTTDGSLAVPDPPDSLDPVATHVGRAQVRTALERVLAVPRTFHALVGQVYDEGAGPDTATGVVACVAHHLLDGPGGDGRRDSEWHLRYEDDYRRTADGWRISRRSARIDLIRTVPVRRWREPAG